MTPLPAGDGGGACGKIIVKAVMFAVTGVVLRHARRAVEFLPAVVAGEPRRIAVRRHQPVFISKLPHLRSRPVHHAGQLTVIVIPVLHQIATGAALHQFNSRQPLPCRGLCAVQ